MSRGIEALCNVILANPNCSYLPGSRRGKEYLNIFTYKLFEFLFTDEAVAFDLIWIGFDSNIALNEKDVINLALSPSTIVWNVVCSILNPGQVMEVF